jgi:hypothetical protein
MCGTPSSWVSFHSMEEGWPGFKAHAGVCGKAFHLSESYVCRVKIRAILFIPQSCQILCEALLDTYEGLKK